MPAKALVAILALLAARSAAWGAGTEAALRRGNRLYDKAQYVEALKNYAEAGRKKPRDPRPPFNAGDALYRLEQYDQAAQAFTALTDPRVPAGLRADSHYNLGNVHFQKQDFAQAVEQYRRALTLSPADPDIRHNLALALKMLQHPPPKKNPQNKNQPPKDQNKENPPKQDPSRSPSGGKNNQPAPRPRDQISREDAERILRAEAEKEKAQSQRIQKRGVQNKPPQVEEDW